MRTKSDSKLQEDVQAELEAEPSVNAAHIAVQVLEGVVTLAGHVDSYAEKCGAEQAAQRVSGEQAVVVDMDVNCRPGQAK